MLGVNYKKIESNSVGYKKDYDMFSMDFEEFLWAKGYGEDAVQSMLSHMKEVTPFSALEMEKHTPSSVTVMLFAGHTFAQMPQCMQSSLTV